jgi:hypothetical protein
MNPFKWFTEKQPERGYLLGGLATLQHGLETTFSLNSRLNAAIRACVPQGHGKAPRWGSEFYVVFAIAIATVAYYLATPTAGFQWLAFLTVVWPVYRIAEVIVFLVGWVFVHESKLHSIQRSLLIFFLNMIELSLLFGTLEVSIGSGLPQVDKLNHFFDGLVSIVTIASPTAATSIQGAIEIIRLFASLLIVLVVVGSLAGGVLRRTVEPGERK